LRLYNAFRRFAGCRLCWRITLTIFAAILFIEGAILIPSVYRFQNEQLHQLEIEGFQTVQSIFTLSASNATPSQIAAASERQMIRSRLVGGVIFDLDGKLVARFGEPPELDIQGHQAQTMQMREVSGGDRYEVLWSPSDLKADYAMLARLDSSWISAELFQFIFRITGLIVLVALFVSAVATVVIGLLLMRPLLRLRQNLIAAGENPMDPESYLMTREKDDELSDVMEAFNGMIQKISADLLDRKYKEHELRKAKIIAEQASRRKTTFLAQMSHELRTPLNAIIGFSEILKTQSFGQIENPKYVEYAEDINQSGNHLLSLINDILDISSAAAGKLDLQEQEFDVEDAIRDCVTMLEPQMKEKNIRLDMLIQDNLPAMRGDERRIRQIFINILSNAVKFTPNDGLLTVDAFLDDGGLGIYVSDTGIGIGPDEIDRVFEEFSRTGSERVKQIEGTGLGLPMSKLLTELHGGSLALKSEVNVGTTVQVWLPGDRLVSLAA